MNISFTYYCWFICSLTWSWGDYRSCFSANMINKLHLLSFSLKETSFLSLYFLPHPFLSHLYSNASFLLPLLLLHFLPIPPSSSSRSFLPSLISSIFSAPLFYLLPFSPLPFPSLSFLSLSSYPFPSSPPPSSWLFFFFRSEFACRFRVFSSMSRPCYQTWLPLL